MHSSQRRHLWRLLLSSSLSKENRAAPKATMPTPARATPPITAAFFTCKKKKRRFFCKHISCDYNPISTTGALAVAIAAVSSGAKGLFAEADELYFISWASLFVYSHLPADTEQGQSGVNWDWLMFVQKLRFPHSQSELPALQCAFMERPRRGAKAATPSHMCRTQNRISWAVRD